MGMSLQPSPELPEDGQFSNKIIPAAIKEEAEKALSYFPQLADIHIEIKFKDRIRKSFMQAQPQFNTIFNNTQNRKYYIFINKAFHIKDEEFNIEEIPSEVLIGWIGHELGHIMDYRDRGSWNMILFGAKYLTMPHFIEQAERRADVFAVQHGMAEYLMKTKDFIFENSSLSRAYKAKIERFYLSTEEIMQMAEKLDG
jgi:hypothetical protein